MGGSPRILIVKLSAIGDCLHATPVVAALRKSFPSAHIGWVVHPHCAAVLKGNPNLDIIHYWQRKDFLRQTREVSRELRSQKYDIALDLQGLLKSGFVSLMSGAKKRIGPAECREGARAFYHQVVPRQNQSLHVVSGYLKLAEAVGANIHPEPEMLMPYSQEDSEFAQGLLTGAHSPLVILNPSAGKVIKQWSTSNFAALGDRLINELGASVALTGAPTDRHLGDAILDAMKHQNHVIDTIGKTNLNQLAAVIAKADLFVGGDTGPMHMAQAVGTRTLAIFGPTDPDTLGPRHPPHQSISLRLDCSPCRHRECPIGHGCLVNLQVEAVFDRAQQMLAGTYDHEATPSL